jgi:hypothetical protein
MRSISLTWTDEITENEAVVYVSAVHEALKAAWSHLPSEGNLVPFPQITPFGNWILDGANPEIDYYSFEWYQEKATDPHTGHLRGDKFLYLVRNEPWQQDTPHYDLSMVHQPLLDQSGHPVLGLADRGRAAVISVHSIRDLKDTWQRLLLLQRLVAHFVGQAFAIPIPEIRKRAHCTNICAMRPATSLAMLLAYSEQETTTESLYCKQCQVEMSQRLIGAHWGNN